MKLMSNFTAAVNKKLCLVSWKAWQFYPGFFLNFAKIVGNQNDITSGFAAAANDKLHLVSMKAG